MSLAATIGCQDLTQALPSGTQNPENFKNAGGATAMYRGALQQFQSGFLSYMSASGLLTDELYSNESLSPATTGLELSKADRRKVDEDVDGSHKGAYRALNTARNNAMHAIAALDQYMPDSSSILRAELYALQGYAEVMLAEGFCSGIPLSKIDFEGDYQYASASTTSEVMRHAIALFDTALVLSRDSVRISALARIGKARALLFLDSTQAVASIVYDVPDTYQYRLPIKEQPNIRFINQFRTGYGIVSDREGGTGVSFVKSRDPRSASYGVARGSGNIDSIYLPSRYNVPAAQLWIVVGNSVEARLMEAEMDLRNSGTQWIETLNALRTDGTFTTTPNASGAVDTIWNAGIGGVKGLHPLRDPVIDPLPEGKTVFDARIDLLFTERAFWLFLTGHRQGDLRRLLRPPFLRPQEAVYPSGFYGPYGNITGLIYGDEVTLPVPKDERRLNPYYRGCLSREA